MYPRELKTRPAVVEGCPLPRYGRVAYLTGGREIHGDVVGIGRLLILSEVAGNAIRPYPLEHVVGMTRNARGRLVSPRKSKPRDGVVEASTPAEGGCLVTLRTVRREAGNKVVRVLRRLIIGPVTAETRCGRPDILML